MSGGMDLPRAISPRTTPRTCSSNARRMNSFSGNISPLAFNVRAAAQRIA